MKTIPVTCAIIFHQGKVLVAKRSESMELPGKWEFPGGKIEDGENPEDCLIREISEELSVDIKIIQKLSPCDHSYTPGKIIRLIPFTARLESFEFDLLEHEKIDWLENRELFSLDWAAADLPIVHELHEKWVKLVEQTKPID